MLDIDRIPRDDHRHLASADAISEAGFDCLILTQTLQLIYDARSAVTHARRILNPAGVLLVTVPAISPIVDDDQLTDYWRFTPASCAELLGDVFGHESIRVRIYGNMLTAIAFLTEWPSRNSRRRSSIPTKRASPC